MADSSDDVVYDIFAIYKSANPSLTFSAEEQVAITNQIIDGLTKTPAVIPNEKLRIVVEKYINTMRQTETLINLGKVDVSTSISNRILTFFKTQASATWEGFWKNMESFVNNSFGGTWKKLLTDDKEKTSKMLDSLVEQGFISNESKDFLVATFARVGAPSGLAYGAVVFGVVVTVLFNSVGIMMGDFVKNLNSKFTPNNLDPATLIRAMHIAPELSESINKKLGENGLDKSDIDLAKIASYATQDIQTIRDCFLRGVISQADAVNRLEELSFTPQRIKEIMSLWEIIPSPSDILWMVGKEAFEPDQIKAFGLDAELPTEQLDWLRKQGYSDYWAKKYWIAHWDYPSEGRVLELYHRGIIGDAELNAFYRVIEMPPYWRDKLKEASYSLYTRVDLRRMHDTGIISSEEVYNNFRGEGYDDDKAKKLTAFYLKYNELNDKDLTLSQVKNAYEADMITKEQAKNALLRLQYTEDQALFILEYVEYEEMIKIQKLRIKSIAKMYKAKQYDMGKTRTMLASLGVEAKWIEVYLTQWNEEMIHDEALPDKTELIKWLSDGSIDVKTFSEYMTRRGYSDKTIALYVSINAPKS